MGIKNILIVGCGRVAGGYDDPNSKKVLTHLGAINRIFDDSVSVDIVDPNYLNYSFIKKKWYLKGNYYKSINEIKFVSYDVILISCNTRYHLENIKYIANNIKCYLVICEKPCCNNYDEIILAKELCESKGINLYVNYQRRLTLEWNEIKNDINLDKFGEFQFGNIYYSKGLINNCSHAINLIYFIFDNYNIEIKNITDCIYDYSKDDPTLSFSLGINKKMINFIGLNDKNFSIFEIDLIFNEQRIRCIESGTLIERYKLSKDNIYQGYKSLNFINKDKIIDEPFLTLWQIIASRENQELKNIKVEEGIQTFKLINDLMEEC